MYHSIVTRRVKKEDDEFVTRITFRTSDVKEVSIEEDSAGLPIKGWLTLASVSESESAVYSFTREHNAVELDMLDQLGRSLECSQSYYEDEQGNIFPFDKIMYVNAAKFGFVLAPGIEIALHPTSEWPRFRNDYINWMDLHK